MSSHQLLLQQIETMKPGIRNIDRVQKALEAAQMLSAEQKSNLNNISTLPNERSERLRNLKQRVLRTDMMKEAESGQFSQNNQSQLSQKAGTPWDIFRIQQPLLAFKQPERAYQQEFQNKIEQTRLLFKSTKEKRNTEQKQPIPQIPQPIKQVKKPSIFDPVFINQTNSSIFNNQSKEQNSQSLFNNPNQFGGSVLNADQKNVQILNNSQFSSNPSNLFSNSQEQKKQEIKDVLAEQHSTNKNEEQNLPQKTSQNLVTSKGFVPGLFNSNPNSSLFSQTMPRMQENTNFQPIKPNSGLFSEGNPINEIKTEKCFNIFGNNSNAQLNKKEQKVSQVQQKETQKSIHNQINTQGNLFGAQTDQNKSSIFQPKTHNIIPEPQKSALVTNIFGNSLKAPELSQSNMFGVAAIGGNVFSNGEKKQTPIQNNTSLFNSNKPSDSSNETPKFNMFETKKEQKPSVFGQPALNQQNQTIKSSSLFSSVSPNQTKPNLPSLFNFSSQQHKQSQQIAPAKQISLFGSNSSQFPKTQQADKKTNIFSSDLSKKPIENSQNSEKKVNTSIFGNPKPVELKQPENNQASQKSVAKKNPTEMFGDFFKSKGQTGNIFTKDQPNQPQPGNIFAQVSSQSSSLPGNIFGNQSNMFLNKNSAGATGLFSGPAEPVQKQLKKEDDDQEEGDGEEDDGILEDKSEIDPNLSTGNYKYEETDVVYKQTLPKLKKGSNNLVEAVTVSIQKFKASKYYNLNVRLANKIIYFTGMIIPGGSVISKINENQYKNLLLRGIAWVNPEGKTAGQIFKLQFKDEKQGQLFYDKFSSVCKKVE